MVIYLSFKQMVIMLKNNVMLFISLLPPIICGITFKYIIPTIEKYLTVHFNSIEIIAPYYVIFDLFLTLTTPLCFIAAMFTLEEIDDKIVNYFAVTTLGKKRYLISRFAIPLLISFIITIICLSIFHLTKMSFYKIVIISFLGSIQGLILSLIIVSLSKNKLEGIAVSKLSSIYMIGILVPFFIRDNNQYIFSILPAFWMAKSIENDIFIIVCIFVSTTWIYFLLKKFYKKIS